MALVFKLDFAFLLQLLQYCVDEIRVQSASVIGLNTFECNVVEESEVVCCEL